MSTPQKTLLIEKISYIEEAFRHIRETLKALINHIEIEYEKVIPEFDFLKTKENEISEQTFNKINGLLEDAWEKAMLARKYLEDLDDDFVKCDEIMNGMIVDFKKVR